MGQMGLSRRKPLVSRLAENSVTRETEIAEDELLVR